MPSNVNTSFADFEYGYKTSLDRFVIYDGIRIIQMIIGIVGNGLTIHIIRNLKDLNNGHILMVYIAVSHILVNCVVPLATFTDFIGSLENSSRLHWKTWSLCKDSIYLATSVFSYICYSILSVDRLVYFFLAKKTINLPIEFFILCA